jgi:hypothetical protein
MAVLEGGINPRGGSLLGRWHLVEPLPRRAHFWPESLCFASLCSPAPLAAPLVSPVVSPLVSLSPDGCPSSIVHLSSMCYLSTPTKWSNSASDFYCVSTSEPSVLRQHTCIVVCRTATTRHGPASWRSAPNMSHIIFIHS